ncbi:hypothetical protein XENOCAPTIV_004939 [Xenoophorus captivus]|uniref:Uncharacterized protein n=1 Tax=Xenoophorus captivus TaxID=1517983 RepID=A0ABV0QHG0_9TELE
MGESVHRTTASFELLKSCLYRIMVECEPLLKETIISPILYHILCLIQEQVVSLTILVKEPRHSSPQRPSPAHYEGSKVILRLEGMQSPSSKFLVCPKAYSQWDWPGKPPEGGAQEGS